MTTRALETTTTSTSLMQESSAPCIKSGHCNKCGETRTHVRVKAAAGWKTRLKPISSENRDGTYMVYKGYCLGARCWRLEEVKKILQEQPVPRKKGLKQRFITRDKREDLSSDADSDSHESHETEETTPTEEDDEPARGSSSRDLYLDITDAGRAQQLGKERLLRDDESEEELLKLVSQEPSFYGKQVTIHMEEEEGEDANNSSVVLNEYGLAVEEDRQEGDLFEIASSDCSDSSNVFESGQSGIFTINEDEEEDETPSPAPPAHLELVTPNQSLEQEEDEFDRQMAALVASRSRQNVFNSPAKNKYRAAIRPTVPTSAGRRKVLGIKSPPPPEEAPLSPRSFRNFSSTQEAPPSPIRPVRLQSRDEEPPSPPTPDRPVPHGRENVSPGPREETVMVGRSLNASDNTDFSSVDFCPDMDDDKSIVSDKSVYSEKSLEEATADDKEEPFDADESIVESEASNDDEDDDKINLSFRQYATTSGSMEDDDEEKLKDDDEGEEESKSAASPNSSFRRYATTSLSFEQEKPHDISQETSGSFPRDTTALPLEDDEGLGKCAATPATTTTKSTAPVDLDDSNPSSSSSFPRYAPVAPGRKTRSGPVDLDELDDDAQVGPVDLDEIDDLQAASPVSRLTEENSGTSQPVVVGKNSRSLDSSKSARVQSAALATAPVALSFRQSRSPIVNTRKAPLSPVVNTQKATEFSVTASIVKKTKGTKTGIAFKRSNGQCFISKLVEGGLFFGTELEVGDKVLSVNKVDCRGKEIKYVANLVRVAKGTVTVVASRTVADGTNKVPTLVSSPASSRKSLRSCNDDNSSVVSDISAMTDTFGAAAHASSPRNSRRKGSRGFVKLPTCDDDASVSSSFTITTARPNDASFTSSTCSSMAYGTVQDESYKHAMKSGVLWLTLVGQHVRFPKNWFNGARAPHMGVSNLLTKQGQKEPQHRWAYIARDVFHSEPILNEYVPNKQSPGRLLMHIVIRDESWKPVQDVAIGCYHPYAKSLSEEKGEDSRVLWLAIRRRSGHRVGSTVLVDPILASECRIEDVRMETPLGRGRRIQNKNLLAIFGDQPPVQTVFILETELVKKVRASREREYITDFKPITLLLLELFLQSKVEL